MPAAALPSIEIQVPSSQSGAFSATENTITAHVSAPTGASRLPPSQTPQSLTQEIDADALSAEGSPANSSVKAYTATLMSENAPFTVAQITNAAAFLWASVAVALFCWRLFKYLVFSLSLRRERIMIDDADMQAAAEKIFGHPVSLYYTDVLAGPALAGLFSPAVYFTVYPLPQAELLVVLEHEACHARHRDILTKWLLFVACCICWFNPLVWMMAGCAAEDMERACDESVLKDKDISFCKFYGSAILSTLQMGRRSAFSTEFGGGAKSIKIRFACMFDRRKKRRLVPILALLLAAVLLSGSLISCTAAPDGSTSSAPIEAMNPSDSDASPSTLPDSQIISRLAYAFSLDQAVFLGDSLTQGWGTYDFGSGDAALAGRVISELSASLPDEQTRWQDNKTKKLYSPIDKVVGLNPVHLLLQFGTNGLAENTEETPKQLLSQYAVTIDLLKGRLPGCVLYLQAVPYTTQAAGESHPGLSHDSITAFNDALAALAGEKGCMYLDVNEVLAPDGVLKSEYAAADGIHITPEGYLAWKSYLLDRCGFSLTLANAQCRFPLLQNGYLGFAEDEGAMRLYAYSGTPIYAVKDGTVLDIVQNDAQHGSYLLIDHGEGLVTQYGNCSGFADISKGDKVAKGQTIAYTGLDEKESRSYLYFTATLNGQPASALWNMSQTDEVIAESFDWLVPVAADGFQYVTRGYHEQSEHFGIDFAGQTNTPIFAVEAGVVKTAETSATGYGNHLILDHGNGLSTLYAQCNSLAVKAGEQVEKGQVIGYLGSSGNSTGPHLHFEVRQNGTTVDPALYFCAIETPVLDDDGFLHFQF